MSGIDTAQRAIDAGFRRHGFDAEYADASGVAKGVRLLLAMPDVDVQLATAQARSVKRLFKVRTAEVDKPSIGASIVLNGEQLPIRDAYHASDDPYRLVWTLECGDPV